MTFQKVMDVLSWFEHYAPWSRQDPPMEKPSWQTVQVWGNCLPSDDTFNRAIVTLANRAFRLVVEPVLSKPCYWLKQIRCLVSANIRVCLVQVERLYIHYAQLKVFFSWFFGILIRRDYNINVSIFIVANPLQTKSNWLWKIKRTQIIQIFNEIHRKRHDNNYECAKFLLAVIY